MCGATFALALLYYASAAGLHADHRSFPTRAPFRTFVLCLRRLRLLPNVWGVDRGVHQDWILGQLSECQRDPLPVLLWLHPTPPQSAVAHEVCQSASQQEPSSQGETKQSEQQKKRKAKRKKAESNQGGLLTLRHETSLFSVAEMANLDRAEDEDDDLQDAENNANEMDELTITRDNTLIVRKFPIN